MEEIRLYKMVWVNYQLASFTLFLVLGGPDGLWLFEGEPGGRI